MAGGDIEWSNGDFSFRVEGLTKALKALEASGTEAEEMRDLMHALGMIVVSAARPHVPTRTGRLAATLRAGRGKTKAVARAGGARTPYAGVIHYGWPRRNITPQPFLVDAFQGQRGAIYQALDDGISDLLRKTHLI